MKNPKSKDMPKKNDDTVIINLKKVQTRGSFTRNLFLVALYFFRVKSVICFTLDAFDLRPIHSKNPKIKEE